MVTSSIFENVYFAYRTQFAITVLKILLKYLVAYFCLVLVARPVLMVGDFTINTIMFRTDITVELLRVVLIRHVDYRLTLLDLTILILMSVLLDEQINTDLIELIKLLI